MIDPGENREVRTVQTEDSAKNCEIGDDYVAVVNGVVNQTSMMSARTGRPKAWSCYCYPAVQAAHCPRRRSRQTNTGSGAESRSAAPTHAIADHVIALGKTIATGT